MNSDSLLLRQVSPAWIQEDRPTSQTFTPTSKDDGKLSTYNGDKWTPEQSLENHESQGLKSIGVLAVTCHECESIGRSVEEDNIPFDGHCFIDFKSLGKSAIKSAGKKLIRFARERDWLFQIK